MSDTAPESNPPIEVLHSFLTGVGPELAGLMEEGDEWIELRGSVDPDSGGMRLVVRSNARSMVFLSDELGERVWRHAHVFRLALVPLTGLRVWYGPNAAGEWHCVVSYEYAYGPKASPASGEPASG